MTVNEVVYNIPTPKELKKELDKTIIGQDDAKMTLSVAIYNHYKRMIIQENAHRELDKSNIIIAGPTGCGKTSIIKSIAKMINVPCYVADATTLTQAGYVGDDVESILVGLLRAANYNVPLAEYGIIFLDEVDKLAKKGANEHISRDVVGEGVQQALLKMVEGGIVGVPPQGGRKHPEQELVYINTKNILFIAGGAFVGLDKIIEKRLNIGSVQHVGFESVNNKKIKFENYYDMATTSDYRKFGLIPEFIGRFQILTYVDKLTKDDLKSILTKPTNSIINQYKELFKADGVELEFTKGALDLLAEIAYNEETGARGLRHCVDKVMNWFMFEIPGSDIVKLKITKSDVKNAWIVEKENLAA